MDYGKYIIVEQSGCELAIMFDKIISHSDMASPFRKDAVIAAGEFEACVSENFPDDIWVNVFGKSTTLSLTARVGIDEALLKRVLSPMR
jgi:hypothetical protein